MRHQYEEQIEKFTEDIPISKGLPHSFSRCISSTEATILLDVQTFLLSACQQSSTVGILAFRARESVRRTRRGRVSGGHDVSFTEACNVGRTRIANRINLVTRSTSSAAKEGVLASISPRFMEEEERVRDEKHEKKVNHDVTRRPTGPGECTLYLL